MWTLVGWGAQLGRLEVASQHAKEQLGIDCEIIDLQTILPWDVETVEKSVQKTGKLIVSHEAPITLRFLVLRWLLLFSSAVFGHSKHPFDASVDMTTPFPSCL